MSADSLFAFDLDPRGIPYSYNPGVPWPIPLDQSSSIPPATHQAPNGYLKRSTSPLETIDSLYDPQQQQQQPFIPQWPISQPSTAHFGYSLDNTYPQQFTTDYGLQYQTSPTAFMSTQPQPDPAYQIQSSYLPLGGQLDNMSLNWPHFQNDLVGYPGSSGLPDASSFQGQTMADSSPSDTYLEVRSHTSSSSDGWVGVEFCQHPFASIDAFQDPQVGAISNPEQTLHGRTFSDSSYSDGEQQSHHSWSSYAEVPHAVGSPGSDSFGEVEFYNIRNRDTNKFRPTPPAMFTTMPPKPVAVKKSTSPQRSPIPIGKASPPTRRHSRKNNSPKTTKSIIRRPVPAPKVAQEPSEEKVKRVGRRKGPLRPDQRKQASEIRKLGACLRCKFLKKTVSSAA